MKNKSNKISGNYWGSIKKNALKRKIIFNLTIKEAWEKFKEQSGRCAYTNMRLTHTRYLYRKNKRNFYKKGSASLDRINSNKPYDVKNIQWVHKHVNNMKSTYTEKYFLKMCEKITNENNKRK